MVLDEKTARRWDLFVKAPWTLVRGPDIAPGDCIRKAYAGGHEVWVRRRVVGWRVSVVRLSDIPSGGHDGWPPAAWEGTKSHDTLAHAGDDIVRALKFIDRDAQRAGAA